MYQLSQAFAGLTLFPQFVVSELKLSKDKHGNQKFKANGKPRWDKIPCDQNGERLGWSKKSMLLTYVNATQRLTQLSAQFPTRQFNLGYIFTEDDGYAFLDLDDCADPTSPTGWNKLAMEIIALLPGAAVEVSSSGSGLHIIYRTTSTIKSRCKNKNWTIELYCGKKFMMFGYPSAIGDCNTDHTKAHASIIASYQLEQVHSVTTGIALTEEWGAYTAILPQSNFTTKQEILDLLFRIKKPKTFTLDPNTDQLTQDSNWFQQLYYGDISNYESMSEADYAFVGEVLWASGNNLELTEQIWLESGLSREKLERMDYVRGTILKLRRTNPSVYVSSYRAQDTAPSSTSQGLRPLPIQKCQYSQLTENGKPANSVENLKQLLTYYNITVRWNDMTHIREVSIPNTILHIGDAENSALCHVIDLCSINNLPVARIDEQLSVIAQENTYHPIVESVLKNPWDGIPRLDTFIKTLKTKDDLASHPLVRTWMLATIAAAFSERGFTHQGILVLEGPQGIEKTRWVKSLEPFDCGAVKEAMLLDLANKDCIITALSHWIVELGELDGTIRKTDMAKLKSFSTSQVDIVRFPYARKNTKLYRRTSFIASVNEPRFLTDPTGNRRWWVISLIGIDLLHGLDMQQVWSEAYHYWKKGEKTYLDREQIKELNKSNSNYEMVDPFEERLLTYFDWSEGWEMRVKQQLTSSDVLRLLGFLQNGNKQEPTRMANLLRKYTTTATIRRHYWLPTSKIIK